jgi:undecaprenyl-diphosphatase
MITTLLSYDTSLLISARGLIGPEYAILIQILGESVVLWCMLLLIGIWLKWVIGKNDNLKVIALQIFSTIILVFILYAIINFGIPKWRPSPQEVVWGIVALIPHPIDNSFPSGHALFSWALLYALWKYYRHGWIIGITMILAVATLASRVIGWVHYPWDILGWLTIGIVGGVLLKKVITSEFMKEKIYPFIISVMKWIKL